MHRYLLYVLLLFNYSVYSYDVKTYIPVNAYKYAPMVKEQTKEYFPALTIPWYIFSLTEQENCVSLTSSGCYNPKTTLKTSREIGIGFSQITKAFNKDGSVRFDSLSDMRRKYNAELKEMSWSNIASRPDLQFRTLILMTRDNYDGLYTISDEYERLSMTDASYNEGPGGVRADRRLCSLTHNCNPNIWFENVERTCSRSKKVIYGNRSACDIRTEHVHNTMKLRLNKYQVFFK